MNQHLGPHWESTTKSQIVQEGKRKKQLAIWWTHSQDGTQLLGWVWHTTQKGSMGKSRLTRICRPPALPVPPGTTVSFQRKGSCWIMIQTPLRSPSQLQQHLVCQGRPQSKTWSIWYIYWGFSHNWGNMRTLFISHSREEANPCWWRWPCSFKNRLPQNSDVWIAPIRIIWNDDLWIIFLHPHCRTMKSLWVRGQHPHLSKLRVCHHLYIDVCESLLGAGASNQGESHCHLEAWKIQVAGPHSQFLIQ